MASRAEKKAQKKRERAERLKNRAAAASKGKETDIAAKRMGALQLWIVAGLFVAAGAFIVYAYN